ncbi:MAG: TM0996/MTH895 family glutaredoxin-like protein [Desulfobulbaceae bacterium]|uniref:TM0996/MTH895 family glutaredoxin-like protein n=1 Tax=Candidatus Desulfobia pelagia TaxID=2841692 RepID=A0A8J6NE80_9BACT|nr:TM0996/MTH895 family glutaredoxin-like protein [Candidatus Desulfobia pelagia]
MEIKVCGPGCAKCHEAERIVREALEESGIEASVEKVSDFNEIAKLGVFSTPAVIIDGQAKCVGKVPTKKDVLAWIK